MDQSRAPYNQPANTLYVSSTDSLQAAVDAAAAMAASDPTIRPVVVVSPGVDWSDYTADPRVTVQAMTAPDLPEIGVSVSSRSFSLYAAEKSTDDGSTLVNVGSDYGYYSQALYPVPNECSDLRLWYRNQRIISSIADMPNTNTIYVRARIEWTQDSVLHWAPMYFGGQRTATIDGGASGISDPISVTIPAGTDVLVNTRVWVGNSGHYIPRMSDNIAGVVASNLVAIDAEGDFTMQDSANEHWNAGTAPSGLTVTNAYCPCAMLGKPTQPKTSLLVLGDSIMNTRSHQLPDDGLVTQTLLDSGVGAAARGTVPYLMLATASETVADVVGYSATYNHTGIHKLKIDGYTHAVCNYGCNDLGRGRTLAQIQADLVKLWTMCANRGQKVYQLTIPPRVGKGYGTAVSAWSQGSNYSVGDIVYTVRAALGSLSGYCYICTKDGVSGGTEPTWGFTSNWTSSDNDHPSWAYYGTYMHYTPQWNVNVQYNVGDLVQPSTMNGYHYRCTVAVKGGSEPTWATTGGWTDSNWALVGTSGSVDTFIRWASGTTYAVQDHCIPYTPNGYYYRCTVVGDNGQGQPTWTTTIGQTCKAGTGPTWLCVGSILTDVLFSVAAGVYPYHIDRIYASESIRRALNTWIRTVPAPLAGVFDVAAAVESGGASAPTGKWVTSGAWTESPGTGTLATKDGIHLSPSGLDLAQAVVDADLLRLPA